MSDDMIRFYLGDEFVDNPEEATAKLAATVQRLADNWPTEPVKFVFDLDTENQQIEFEALVDDMLGPDLGKAALAKNLAALIMVRRGRGYWSLNRENDAPDVELDSEVWNL